MHPSTYDAVILAGGRGSRLGGLDKASVRLGESTLLERALAAAAHARNVVVVGPPRSLPVGVLTAWEEPADGGPVAGLYAGFDALATQPNPATLVLALAVDMPNVDKATIARLVDHLGDSSSDAAFLSDGTHRHLVGVIRASALKRARPVTTHAESVRRFLAPLAVVDVPAHHDEAHDLDTPADLEHHQIAHHNGSSPRI